MPHDSTLGGLTFVAIEHSWHLFVSVYLVIIFDLLLAADGSNGADGITLAVHHLRSDHVVSLTDVVDHHVFGN